MNLVYLSNMRIIDMIKQKIKHFGPHGWLDEIFFTTLILFVAVGAFSFGMMHERKRHQIKNPVEITYNQEHEILWDAFYGREKNTRAYVASKNSTVFYPLHCKAANRINQENMIYFDDMSDAEGLGYRAYSGSC